MTRLKRFLAPQVAELDLQKAGDESVLAGQRAEVVAVFCDLRGFTAFSAHAEPEDIMQVLREYYEALGAMITRYEATLTSFSADGSMVLVNAPVPCEEPALHAVKMAVDMQDAVQAPDLWVATAWPCRLVSAWVSRWDGQRWAELAMKPALTTPRSAMS